MKKEILERALKKFLKNNNINPVLTNSTKRSYYFDSKIGQIQISRDKLNKLIEAEWKEKIKEIK